MGLSEQAGFVSFGCQFQTDVYIIKLVIRVNGIYRVSRSYYCRYRALGREFRIKISLFEFLFLCR